VTNGKGLLQEFKTFALRGNVVELAVAVVIGAAFGAVVNALVKDLITPIIAAVFGKPDFSSLTFSINHSRFLYGDFLNAVIAFVSIAAAVFLFVVKPVNMLVARFTNAPDPEAPAKTCPECLTAIPLAARRCFACTASQAT
jgi:large conductance mechanosensitive channel